jgi:hypothetical protein
MNKNLLLLKGNFLGRPTVHHWGIHERIPRGELPESKTAGGIRAYFSMAEA